MLKNYGLEKWGTDNDNNNNYYYWTIRIIIVFVVNLIIFSIIIISFVLFSDIGSPQLLMHFMRKMCCSSIICQETQQFKVRCYVLVCCCCFIRNFCKYEVKLSQSCIIFVSILKSEFLQPTSISAWVYYWSWLENILKHDWWKGQCQGWFLIKNLCLT